MLSNSAQLHFNSSSPEIWGRNCVLSGSSRGHTTEVFTGTLSIKWTLKGSARWVTPTGEYKVTPLSYLVLNHGQQYQLEMPKQSTTQTFAVFFRPGFIADLFSAQTATAGQLLEARDSMPINFFERLNPTADEVGRALSTLSSAISKVGVDSDEADEAFLALGLELLRSQDLAKGQCESLRKASASVQEEVFRRLNVARDAVLSDPAGDHSLERLAHLACLTPNYFHELFRRAYGEAPHRFVVRTRMRHGQYLLSTSGDGLEQIAGDVGFQNASSFCHAFKRSFGLSPTAFRDKN